MSVRKVVCGQKTKKKNTNYSLKRFARNPKTDTILWKSVQAIGFGCVNGLCQQGGLENKRPRQIIPLYGVIILIIAVR